MRQLKLAGIAMIGILVLFANIASSASAKPEFLDNVQGNTFTGNSGAGEFTTLGGILAIKFKEATISGEITGNEEGVIKAVAFKGASAFGLTASSLGDAAGTILLGKNIPFKLCYIKETAPVEVGIIIEKIPTVHIDVLGGSLANLEGSMIGSLASINQLQTVFTFLFKKSSAGGQNHVTCKLLGKTLNASFTSSEDTKHEKPESAALEVHFKITLFNDIQIDA